MKRMNKIKSLSLGVITAMALMTGCNDDFLDTQPLSSVPSEIVWTDGALAEAFVTDLYTALGQGGFDEQMQASLTDEAVFTHPGRGINTVTEARTNPADRGFINYTLDWDDMYSKIRAANLAISNLREPQFDNPELVERLLGEALFMRSYFYHQLLRYYGGVPLVDSPYELGAEDYSIARNTFAETVEFIVKDAEEAAQMLDGAALVKGRASKAAALALRSRVLLYAASDLHDIPTASAKSDVIAAYEFPALIGYTEGDQMERWRRAQAAAMDVLLLPGYGFKLDLSAPVTPEEGFQNYVDVSLFRGGGEEDMIFGRYFIQSKNEGGGRVGLYNGPNGYRNWAGNTPIQQLVDDYEMMDGTKFSWDNPEHAANPYENRDPRFDASILHDASDWKPRFTTTADPANQIQTGQYEVIGASGQKTTHFGLDTRQSSIEDWNGTRTGYYMRRFIDPNPNLVDMNMWQQVPWAFFRYTEAVLNYVEASIELGEFAQAQEWLNKVRFRVGMPAVTEAGDDLMARYRNERRIEMAYEEQRFHDVRRWMIAQEEFGEQPQIVDIKGTLKPGKTVSQYQYNPENYNYTYNVIELGEGIENRAWEDKMFFFPISRDEMNRNEQLEQNPGY